LVANEDVKVGDLLWAFEAVTGIVAAVDPVADTVTLTLVTSGGAPYTGSITDAMPVITPDFAFIQKTSLGAAIAVTAGVPAGAITLTAVTRDDTGASLQPGDVVTLAVVGKSVLLVVTKTSPIVGSTAMRADYKTQTLPV